MLAALAAWVAGVVLWEIVDFLGSPRRPFLAHPGAAAIRAAVPTFIIAGLIAATGNVLLALLGTVLSVSAGVFLSRIKLRVLDEPIVFTDFALAAQVFRHPKLYFPYSSYSLWSALLWVATLVFAVMVAWVLGESCDFKTRLVGAAIAGAGVFAVISPSLRRPLDRALAGMCPLPDLRNDTRRWGVTATLCIYALRWQRVLPSFSPSKSSLVVPSAPRILILVECESFADPFDLGVASSPLPHLAAARSRARFFGELKVDGVGANTMRTEFGVLTGTDEAELAFDRYNPYLRAYRTAPNALAARLASAGYRCEFVHPYDPRFFGRDRVVPALGFHTFFDQEQFTAADRVGSYICDAAVGHFILQRISECNEPLFIFAVTMEAHGPWAGGPDAVDQYEIHAKNSDALLGMLIAGLDASGADYLLAFFGDHRPALPAISPNVSKPITPFVIVSKDSTDGRPRSQCISPAELNKLISSALFLDG